MSEEELEVDEGDGEWTSFNTWMLVWVLLMIPLRDVIQRVHPGISNGTYDAVITAMSAIYFYVAMSWQERSLPQDKRTTLKKRLFCLALAAAAMLLLQGLFRGIAALYSLLLPSLVKFVPLLTFLTLAGILAWSIWTVVCVFRQERRDRRV